MKPGLLISSPQMKDPFFEGTLVLLCFHDETGAMGIVINRETPLPLGRVLEKLDQDSIPEADESSGILAAESPALVLWGGPVEPGAVFVVTRGRVSDDDGWNVGDDLIVSSTQAVLSNAARDGKPFHLVLGYAGWGPRQLDAEFETGSWLYTEAEPAVVLEGPASTRYERALARLGLKADQVWMRPVDE